MFVYFNFPTMLILCAISFFAGMVFIAWMFRNRD